MAAGSVLGDATDNGAREEAGKDFEVEVADVSRSGQVRESRSLGRRLSPQQRFWRLASASGTVALVLLILALDASGRLNPQQFLPKVPSPLTLRPQMQGMACLLDGAWSPQGMRIALLGSAHDVACPDFGRAGRAGLVTVYDAGSGKLLATLHPDDALVRALQTFAQRMAPASTPPSAKTIAPAIAYQHVLWSPDGKRLALTFSLAVTSTGLNLYLPDGEPGDLHGVLVLDANGARPQSILQVESADGPFPDGSFADEWDLQAGAILAASASPFPSFGLLMPALAYRWQTSATPVAATPLSSVAPPPVPPFGPVGNPAGGSSFTIWQPGLVTGVVQRGPAGLLTHLPGVYELTGAFAAWSPDGRYLLDAVAPEGLLELPGTPPPTQDQLNAYGIDGVPLLPLRDAGLAQALRAVNPVNPVGTFITWRPDGRVLA
ncbi:MAG TPA: hypothetical protein VF916_04595, partial [Ktedonobacterales bacterium]